MRWSVCAAAGILVCGSARAAISWGAWFVVPNDVWGPTGQAPSTDPVAGATWSAHQLLTVDLILTGDPGEIILGVSSATLGLGIGRYVFHHPLGSDLRSFALEPALPAIGFDTYVCLGGDDLHEGAEIVLGPSTDLSGTGDRLVFDFEAVTPYAIDSSGRFRVVRMTFGEDLVLVGGFVDVLTMAGIERVWILPPSPGAAALGCFACGWGGARRRR